jgi:HlyD family secretion protein
MSEPKKSRPNPLRVLIPLLLVGGIGFGVWKTFIQVPAVPGNVVQLTGRVEGDDSAIAPKVAGRILEIRFREGDQVKAGDIVATLDDSQVRSRVDQARAAVAEADARVHLAQQQTAIYQDQLQQTQLETGQSKLDSEARVRQAEAELSASESLLAQQEASMKLAAYDRDVYTRLAKEGAVSERQGKQAQSTAESQQAAVDAARKRVDSARHALELARTTGTNSEIRTSQSAAVRKQIAQQQAQIATYAADAVRSRAQLAEAEANLKDLVVLAPFDGTVVTRSAEPGEVVQAGTSIITLLDLNHVYLRGFVPEGQVGKIKLGQAGRVFLDSDVRKPLEAVVTRIDPQATFTPENTYFRDERVKQVVGIKLQLKAGIGFAKPGMPADAEVLVSGDAWPPVTPRK